MLAVGLLLAVTGPWLFYLFVKIPDELAEHRNYGQTAGFALLWAALLDHFEWPLWIAVFGWFSALTAYRAYAWYSSWVGFWSAATQTGSGDLSRAYGEIGAWEKVFGSKFVSEQALRDSLKINPNFACARENLTWVLHERSVREKRPHLRREALEITAESTVRTPRYVKAWHDLSLLLETEGNIVGAWASLVKAVLVDPSYHAAANRLGLLAFGMKRFDDALFWFEMALKTAPADHQYIYNRATVLIYINRADEGRGILAGLKQPVMITHNMIPLEFSGGKRVQV